MIRQNEALYLQNKMNCEGTMKVIDMQYGPFNKDEINFFMNALNGENGDTIINGFQKQLIFNLFFKYFGDTTSIYAINKEDYVKLMIAGRQLLSAHSMILLPYIISSKVDKLISRKSINKKELARIENSALYEAVIRKYRSGKITKSILQLIATIISSDFSIIDYHDPALNGKRIVVQLDMIVEEILSYILLI